MVGRETIPRDRPTRCRRKALWNAMNESMIRHALTASVSALVAAVVTAMVLGGGGERPRDSAPAIPAREGPRDDAALAEAIAEVKRAVERVEMGLEIDRSRSGRTSADQEDGVDAVVEGDASEASLMPSASAPFVVPPRFGSLAATRANESNKAAIRSYRSRYDEAGRNTPNTFKELFRSYQFRTMRDLVDEFGSPTTIKGGSGQITLRWSIADGPSVEARFVDGFCVAIQ